MNHWDSGFQSDMMMELTGFWEHRVTQSFASVRVWIKVRGKGGVTDLGYFAD